MDHVSSCKKCELLNPDFPVHILVSSGFSSIVVSKDYQKYCEIHTNSSVFFSELSTIYVSCCKKICNKKGRRSKENK